MKNKKSNKINKQTKESHWFTLLPPIGCLSDLTICTALNPADKIYPSNHWSRAKQLAGVLIVKGNSDKVFPSASLSIDSLLLTLNFTVVVLAGLWLAATKTPVMSELSSQNEWHLIYTPAIDHMTRGFDLLSTEVKVLLFFFAFFLLGWTLLKGEKIPLIKKKLSHCERDEPVQRICSRRYRRISS